MGIGEWVVLGLSIFFGVWYIGGLVINRRRGEQIAEWLRKGLLSTAEDEKVLQSGARTTAPRLVIPSARAPFKRIETIILLESRELLPLWLANRLRGRQDEIVLRMTLRKQPPIEVEVNQNKGQGTSTRLKTDGSPLTLLPPASGFEIGYRGKANPQKLEALQRFLAEYPGILRSLSLQSKAPHLILRLNSPEGENAEAFFESLSAAII